MRKKFICAFWPVNDVLCGHFRRSRSRPKCEVAFRGRHKKVRLLTRDLLLHTNCNGENYSFIFSPVTSICYTKEEKTFHRNCREKNRRHFRYARKTLPPPSKKIFNGILIREHRPAELLPLAAAHSLEAFPLHFLCFFCLCFGGRSEKPRGRPPNATTM